MDTILTTDQIYAHFPDEWILVGDPVSDEALDVKSGVVLAHSKDRDEVYRQAIALRPRHSAVLYTGGIPDDMAIAINLP
jgi:hypothetical protein